MRVALHSGPSRNKSFQKPSTFSRNSRPTRRLPPASLLHSHLSLIAPVCMNGSALPKHASIASSTAPSLASSLSAPNIGIQLHRQQRPPLRPTRRQSPHPLKIYPTFIWKRVKIHGRTRQVQQRKRSLPKKQPGNYPGKPAFDPPRPEKTRRKPEPSLEPGENDTHLQRIPPSRASVGRLSPTMR